MNIDNKVDILTDNHGVIALRRDGGLPAPTIRPLREELVETIRTFDVLPITLQAQVVTRVGLQPMDADEARLYPSLNFTTPSSSNHEQFLQTIKKLKDEFIDPYNQDSDQVEALKILASPEHGKKVYLASGTPGPLMVLFKQWLKEQGIADSLVEAYLNTERTNGSTFPKMCLAKSLRPRKIVEDSFYNSVLLAAEYDIAICNPLTEDEARYREKDYPQVALPQAAPESIRDQVRDVLNGNRGSLRFGIGFPEILAEENRIKQSDHPDKIYGDVAAKIH